MVFDAGVASASYDRTVQIWNAITGRKIFTHYGHSNTVYTVSWSPDGTRVASAGLDKSVQVWDIRKKANRLTYSHTSEVSTVVWSPNRAGIAFASLDKQVYIWDAVTAKKISIYGCHSSRVRTLAWSPDGKRIASAGDYEDSTMGGHLVSLCLWWTK